MAVNRYIINTINWGPEQAAGTAPTVLALSATGSGVWAAVDIHESIRMGAFVFQSTSDVTHSFAVRAEYVDFAAADALQFRIRDLTNSLTIASVSFNADLKWKVSESFSNLPGADARIQLQYTLTSPSTAQFYCGLWEISRWS